jgi:hypothetical protein
MRSDPAGQVARKGNFMSEAQQTGLPDLVLEAHGGSEQWSRAETIRVRLHLVGPTWTELGQEKTFAGVDVAVEVH